MGALKVVVSFWDANISLHHPPFRWGVGLPPRDWIISHYVNGSFLALWEPLKRRIMLGFIVFSIVFA